MKRRNFLGRAALGMTGAGAVGLGLAAPAVAQGTPQVKWRLASSYPRSLKAIFACSEEFAQTVSDITDGNFQIQVFAAGELVPPLSMVESVSQGTVEMAHTASYFYSGIDPAFVFGTAVPWGMNARHTQAWLFQAGGLDLLNEFYGRHGLLCVPAGNTGTQMAGWFRKELRGVDDLRGLKMRIGGIGGNLLARMGVIPQQIAAGDIYPALEKGTIDATEFVGPFEDEVLGFARVAPYYYFPGFWEGSAELAYFVNPGKWAELPPAYQVAFRTAARTAGANQLAKYDAGNPAALTRLVAAGAQPRELPQDILERSRTEAAAMYAELSGKSPDFKRILEHYMGFARETATYWSIADLRFDYLNVTAMLNEAR